MSKFVGLRVSGGWFYGGGYCQVACDSVGKSTFHAVSAHPPQPTHCCYRTWYHPVKTESDVTIRSGRCEILEAIWEYFQGTALDLPKIMSFESCDSLKKKRWDLQCTGISAHETFEEYCTRTQKAEFAPFRNPHEFLTRLLYKHIRFQLLHEKWKRREWLHTPFRTTTI